MTLAAQPNANATTHFNSPSLPKLHSADESMLDDISHLGHSLSKMQHHVSLAHERMRVTMQCISDAVITTDHLGIVESLNPVAETLTGWTQAEAMGLPLQQVFNIINEKTRTRCINPVEICLHKNHMTGASKNITLISRNGKEYGIENSAAPIRDEEGHILGVVLVFHDISAQKEMADEISYRASHDTLTGLVNRSEFESRLSHILNDMRDPMQDHALMFIDLDQFKVVNDSCGHQAGDKLLKEITQIMEQCIRTSDVLARIGGDEFAIILERCGAEPALKIAQLICKSVDEYRFHQNNQRFRIGASIGLVMIDKQWSNINDLLQAADSACYAAKEAGRNRVHIYFDSDIALETRRGETQWASKIQQAIEDKKFVLYCQRIIPMNEQGGQHGEILIRMKDDAGGLTPPGVFLPAAERFHIATRIDRWVVREVFEWLSENRYGLDHVDSISINLSGQSLGDHSFHEYVLELIDSIAPECSKLCFEITETAAITNINEATKFIAKLKKFGIKFSLDDFGSGVSSFGYLKTLPVDYLKIDGQFIRDLLDSPIDQATVRCITEVAHVTGKKTIAEWVESEEVESMLKDMGIDSTQGYLRHCPAPLNQMLNKNSAFASNDIQAVAA